MIDSSALQMLLTVLTGWLERREREALAYLVEENPLLRRQLGGRRLHLTDDDRVGRSTIARILKAHGLSPVPERSTSWKTFLRAHWGAIAGADFFTTEVWTWRGLVTYDTVFVIDLASRRVQIVGSTPHPAELLMCLAPTSFSAMPWAANGSPFARRREEWM